MALSTALDLSFGGGGFDLLDDVSLLGAGLPSVIVEKILASLDATRLRALDIRGNEIDPQTAREMARRLGPTFKTMRECNGLPIQDIIGNTTRRLRLNGFSGRHHFFGIEAFGAHVLAGLLPENTSLVEIDFRLNGIGLTAAAELGEACAKSQVRYVNQLGSQDLVTDEEVAFLLGYFHDIPLAEIDVSHNAGVTSAASPHIIGYLAAGHMRNLRRLALAGLPWSDDSVVSLVDALGEQANSLLALEELALPLHCGLKRSTLVHLAGVVARCFPTIKFGEASCSLSALRLSPTLCLSRPEEAAAAEFAAWALIAKEMKPSCLRRLIIMLDESTSIDAAPPVAPGHHPLVYWSTMETLRALCICEELEAINISVHPSTRDLGAVIVGSLEATSYSLRELEISYMNYIDLPPSRTDTFPEVSPSPSWSFLTRLATRMPCLERFNGVPLPKDGGRASQGTRDVTKLIYHGLVIPDIKIEHEAGAFVIDVTLAPHFDKIDMLVAWLNLAESDHVLVVIWLSGRDIETKLSGMLQAIESAPKPRVGCKLAFALDRPISTPAMEALYRHTAAFGRVVGLPIFPDESARALELVLAECNTNLLLERLYITRSRGWTGGPLGSLRKILSCLCTPRRPFKGLHLCYGPGNYRTLDKSELIGVLSNREGVESIVNNANRSKKPEKPLTYWPVGLKLSLDMHCYGDLKVVNLCNCDILQLAVQDPLPTETGSVAELNTPPDIVATACEAEDFTEIATARLAPSITTPMRVYDRCPRRWLECDNDEENLRGWIIKVLLTLLRRPGLESVDIRGNGLSVEDAELIWAEVFSGLPKRKLRCINEVALDERDRVLRLDAPEGSEDRVRLSSGDIWVYEQLTLFLRENHAVRKLSMRRLDFYDGEGCLLGLLEAILSGTVQELEIVDCLMGPGLSRSVWAILLEKLTDPGARLESFNGLTIEKGKLSWLSPCSEWNDLSLALAATLPCNRSMPAPLSVSVSGENITDFGLTKSAELIRSGAATVPQEINLEGSRHVTDWGVKATVDALLSCHTSVEELRSISFDNCPAVNPRSAFDLMRAVQSLRHLRRINGFDLAAVRDEGELVVRISEDKPLSVTSIRLASAIADSFGICRARIDVSLRRMVTGTQVDCIFGQTLMLLESLPLGVATHIFVKLARASARKQASSLWARIRAAVGVAGETIRHKTPVIISPDPEALASLMWLSHGLSLSEISFCPSSLTELSRTERSSASALTHLSFRGSVPIGSDGMTCLSSWLTRSATALEILELPGACLGDTGLACLADLLGSLPLLKVLDIRRNLISSDGIRKIVQALRTRTRKFELIDMGENNVSPHGLMEVAELISIGDFKLVNISLARNLILRGSPSTGQDVALEAVSALVYGGAASSSLEVLDLRGIFNDSRDLWHTVIRSTNASQFFDAKYLEGGLLVKRRAHDQ
ncbi:hypothetical protein FOZ60_004464 [Perkinsus olseni]|uniref:Uncharacterized protein n=1 Tax=Perkinsus olseni TaxID=32597 RepID=A0A7J6PPV4_PEROL|nr:hypothetical protein FOZ60_004464 [Perkinsus olseni]